MTTTTTMTKRFSLGAVALALGLALFVPRSASADTDPRDYALVQAPDHTNVFLTYDRYQTSVDTESFVQNVALFRYLHVLRFGDLAFVPVDVVLPVADALVFAPGPGGTTATFQGSGLGDLVFLPTVGYAIKESDAAATYFAFSPYFHFPTGNYDDKHLVNIGTHRFQFDEEVCVGQRLLGGALFLEALGAATFYTKNDDFIPPGTTMALALKQAPTYSATLHASANVTKSVWVGGSYYVTANGKETIATPAGDMTAVPQQTVQSLRATVSLRPAEPLQLLLQYQNDIAASGGGTISRFVGARLSYLF
jgi:hypothetical protein